MATEETELTFIRCPNCRSLAPAVATRCRMCGQLIEQGAESPSSTDSSARRPRVRQRTMSVSDSEISTALEGAEAGRVADIPEPEAAPVEPPREPKPRESQLREPQPREVEESHSPRFSDVEERSESSSRSFLDFGAESETEAPVADWAASFAQSAPQFAPEDLAPVEAEPYEEGDIESDGGEEDEESESGSETTPFAGAMDPASGEQGERRRRRRRRRRKKRSGTAGEGQIPSAAQSEQSRPSRSDPAPAQQARPTAGMDRRLDDEVGGGSGHFSRPSAPEERVELRVTEEPIFQREEQHMYGSTGSPDGKSRDTGFRADEGTSTDQEGVLVGWLVDFESNPLGSAREIRSGRFFVSGEKLRATDLVLKHDSLSTPHCLMRASQGGIQVQDLMSEQGTHVCRAGESSFQRVNEPVALQNGDTIRFGKYELTVCLVHKRKGK